MEMVIVLSLFYWNQSREKKSPSQTTTSMRQSRISWAEEKIVYLPKEGIGDAIRDKMCFASLDAPYPTQELNGSKCSSVRKHNRPHSKLLHRSLPSLHLSCCKADHGSWGILLTPIVAEFSWSFVTNSFRRCWDKMLLEHQRSNPASRTAPIKYRTAPLLHDTHSTPSWGSSLVCVHF